MTSLPLVSFVIPTLNSANTLDSCLRSIAIQDYPQIEIIVVDGGSTDATVEIASKYTVMTIVQKGPLGLARRVGSEIALGEVIGAFDSDIVIPHRNWLRNAVSRFYENPEAGIVWPVNRPPHAASMTTKSYFNLWSAFFWERTKKGLTILPGGNVLILKKAMEQAGSYSRLEFGEDFDLTLRILGLGYRVVHHEDPIFHNSMRTLREFVLKQIRGARSLSMIRRRPGNVDLLKICLSWSFRRSKQSAINDVMSHLQTAIKSTISSYAKTRDSSWLLVPLLLLIRTIVYGSFFLRSELSLL
ncbi:MAG: glycosyltransferase family 2 protein [Candidatus Bathyarchaeota archaeon]|nr:glycosyltransferase family 2 protein [Candidatus Bathyarchaeota archaeon]